ncbi:uncharacterized protein susd3 isoform 2-T2 [Polymixia lowei]
MPMPLPALGTQRIIQGNGTNVGTVISLQCPDKHKLMGGNVICTMGTNSTLWVGENYCKPLTPYDDFGFRVAVVASIVSSAIILLMSMAFITCCIVDCMKEKERKKQERETDLWSREEQIEQREDRRSRYSHKGRNNNNNTQEKAMSLWDNHDPARCVNKRTCRCCQPYHCSSTVPPSTRTLAPAPPSAPLPGRGYYQPLLPQSSRLDQNPGPLENSVSLQHTAPAPQQYLEPSWTSSQTQSSGPSQSSAVGPGTVLVWQYEGQETRMTVSNQPATEESYMMNINSAKECAIRIISV